MNNSDDFGRSVGTVNDELSSRLVAGAAWRTNHPGQKYEPAHLSEKATASEDKIVTICRNTLEAAGSPYTETQLIEFCFAHRALGYPDNVILFLADFVNWQRRQENRATEMTGTHGGMSRHDSPAGRQT